eukprot:1128095-Pyramimonas_sp.AAC.1
MNGRKPQASNSTRGCVPERVLTRVSKGIQQWQRGISERPTAGQKASTYTPSSLRREIFTLQ